MTPPQPLETSVTDRPVRVLWLVKGLGAGGAERLLALSARLRDRTAIDPQVAYLLVYKQALRARRCETHVAVSQAVRASMPGRLQPETRVIQYGVDLCEVRKATVQRESARRSLGVGPDEVLIGTVANLRGTKGYPDLLAAARAVVDEVDNVRFVALGQGPMQRELHETAEELGLAHCFRFLGYRPDAVQIMSGFDIFCLASHHEGLPIALMEALVLGLPVVATNVGGIAEIVTDGREAILVPPGEPQQLAAALMTVARDPALRAEMSLHAVASGDTLDVTLALRAIEDLYREVLDR